MYERSLMNIMMCTALAAHERESHTSTVAWRCVK